MEKQHGQLFRPTQLHQPVAIVILIENSQEMSQLWPDLRDKCLDRLVDNLEQTNPPVPITVSVLESYPCQSPGPNSSLARQYSGYHDGLRDVRFNASPENKISAGHISTCIDFLDAANYRVPTPALHLIIVAFNTPSDTDNGITYVGNGYSSPWLSLAKEMGSKNIHCHLVVSPQNDMGSLTLLFEETLRMQGNVEEYLYPPTDPTQVILRLSARPNYDHQQDMSESLNIRTSKTFDEATGAPVSSEGDQPQSLVSQLQQYHGLTKKKVYGAKPTRQPFFRDERVGEKHRQPPAPLTMPLTIMNSVPSPTGGGRTISHSRVDRMNRVSQASPTDMHRRTHSGWTRRGSRMSTPEADHPWTSPPAHTDMSPGGSYIVSELSSGGTPIVIDDVYGHPAAVTSMPPPPAHVMPPGTGTYRAVGTAEGNWTAMQAPQGPQQYIGSYNPAMQPYIPAEVSPYVYSENSQLSYPVERVPVAMPPSEPVKPSSFVSRPPHSPVQSSPPSMVISQAHHGASSASAQIPQLAASAVHAPPPQLERGAPTNATNISRTIATNKKTVEDDNEERFSFSDEFVVATAVLFEAEVLPAYPDYPGSSSGLFTSNGAQQILPSLPATQAGELYASRDQSRVNLRSHMNTNAATALQPHGHAYGHIRATPYVPTSASAINNDTPMYAFGAPHYATPNYGSSLTGWAG
ncbi:hypothetical protein CVT25_008801 [Psilocybe cyanescens]|uniref:Uncharacterized protein n=1 Tax=Psilocybe cyanescens TaxID=93625 RepID=A0A409XL79_PSICY|nr:hypothetical protein CVT25_008801 [Psilocybe cyanescens]